jgi:hypothetical protein
VSGELAEREVGEAFLCRPFVAGQCCYDMAAFAQDNAQVADVGLGTARWIAQAYDI